MTIIIIHQQLLLLFSFFLFSARHVRAGAVSRANGPVDDGRRGRRRPPRVRTWLPQGAETFPNCRCYLFPISEGPRLGPNNVT